MIECYYCKGKMARKAAPFYVNRKGYHLIFDAVPAWVCTQCGEAYFEEREVEEIEDAIRAVDQQAEKIAASA
jgi:YgiT-type zinc finger domain-containing protein